MRFYLQEPAEGYYLDADLDGLVNDAAKKVYATLRAVAPDFFTVSATFQTLQGVKSYELPADFLQMRRLEHASLEDQSEIVKIDRARFPDTEGWAGWPFGGPGKPLRYVQRGSQLDLLPVPDAAYRLRLYYDRTQVDLSADEEVPTSPPEAHDLIALWAAVTALPANGDAYVDLLGLYQIREADLITTMSNRKGPEVRTVTGYLEGLF